MAQVTTPGLSLDLCTRCQFVWFDATEFEAVPMLPPPPPPPKLPPEAAEILALYKVEQMAKEQQEEGPPQEMWKIVPAICGFPVEEESGTIQHVPIITWGIAAACIIVSLCSFANLDSIVKQFGFIPAEPLRYGGATVLFSLLLHGGWWHLIGNMYFLLVFGDNVEDYLGKKRFAILATVAMIAGDFVHWLGDPHSTIPTVGASGMISGILAFYALQFPHARLTMFFRFYWVHIPAWGAFLGWGVLQLIGVVNQLSGFSRVSSLAHVGGALSGIVLWLLWRKHA